MKVWIDLYLSKARDYYKSGVPELKELALKAFSKEDLEGSCWIDIKDFWDAVDALGLDTHQVQKNLKELHSIDYFLVASYKLKIIKEALNGKGWEPSLTEGELYLPVVFFQKTTEGLYPETDIVIGKFRSQGEEYNLFIESGSYSTEENGLSRFDEYGRSLIGISMLACKTKEIAIHFGLYFGKLIFETCFSRYNKIYEWIEE